MNTTFPIPLSLIKAVYNIQHNPDVLVSDSDKDALIEFGYIKSMYGGGWLLSNKGRELLRQYGKMPEFIAIL